MSDHEPQLEHARQCRRKAPPVLRLSWGMQPEWSHQRTAARFVTNAR